LRPGRDASSPGDPIAAEGFFQHAEHYHRLLHAHDDNRPAPVVIASTEPQPGAEEPKANGGAGEQPALGPDPLPF
jgi:hypothetical protein